MDIKRMKKSELVELNGQLNESREHCDMVIEALRAVQFKPADERPRAFHVSFSSPAALNWAPWKSRSPSSWA